MSQVYPLAALRALALYTQMLTTPNGGEPEPTPDRIAETVERLVYVQIDTLQMVARSQYLTLWSRLGSYDPAAFDALIFDPAQRRLFEYWGHAASIIPLSDYRYYRPVMQQARDNPSNWWDRWLHETTNAEALALVRERIISGGGQRAADFEQKGQGGPWWGWKPAKSALEYLFATGEVMIANRVNFQRVYDLRERVLPGWVEVDGATKKEGSRYLVERAGRALGVARPEQVAEYAYMKRGTAAPIVRKLIGEGVFVEIEGEMLNGEVATLVVHRDNLPLLRQAADGAIRAERTTFLSPFDSLFWARNRDRDLWGFQQVLEAYKKPKDRIWGYFCLPILHRDRLIGRFDPKLERRTGALILRRLHLEPGIEPDEALAADVAAAMRDFLAFHDARELAIEESSPAAFGGLLARALGG